MKKWDILSDLRFEIGDLRIDNVVDLLLKNRGITTKEEKINFLDPRLENVTPENVGINLQNLDKAVQRIRQAIEKKEQIVVYGDYDVDGITGSAILWETLHALKANAIPYIPHRKEEGYGLSVKGISNLQSQISNIKLIITVDNGIVANEAVEFANNHAIEVIITDHHVPPEGESNTLPDAFTIVHTTKLCGAGVALLLSQELLGNKVGFEDKYLELATLGTVADLVPLTGANRTIVKYGLEKLTHTQRPGLQELYKSAGITRDLLQTYDIGHIIGPRLNAAGRLESAMDSLRLICTNNRARAQALAAQLEATNKERQLILRQSAEHAVAGVRNNSDVIKNILVIAHEDYEEGVIGLIAGKLVEEFYRPSIVIAKGEKVSKASARSIAGFNIIEFLRSHTEHFVNVGGHPMAAGFTVETAKLITLQEALEKTADTLVHEAMLQRILKIDCELPLSAINKRLYDKIQTLSPFGMGNPEPVFASRGVTVKDFRLLGKDGNHLRLNVTEDKEQFEAIGFNMASLSEGLKQGDKINIAYSIDENTWNGNTKLQLKVKDIKFGV